MQTLTSHVTPRCSSFPRHEVLPTILQQLIYSLFKLNCLRAAFHLIFSASLCQQRCVYLRPTWAVTGLQSADARADTSVSQKHIFSQQRWRRQRGDFTAGSANRERCRASGGGDVNVLRYRVYSLCGRPTHACFIY